jgi:hypothetical protein
VPVPHDHNFLASVAEDRRQADLKAVSPLEKFANVWADPEDLLHDLVVARYRAFMRFHGIKL